MGAAGSGPVRGKAPVLIAGPTASGKSAAALALAERIGGVIVNADSMQVYRELRVLTARPAPGDEARVPHRLYGHVSAFAPYSVSRWLDDVRAVLAQIAGAGGRAIITGGTGLYFRALTKGLSPMPPVPAAIREALRARAAEEGVAALHAELASRDPLTAARLQPADRQRVLRALEVLEATGRGLAAFQAEAGEATLDEAATVRLVLAPDRAMLRERIARRFHAMVSGGALEEARALMALDPALPAAKAHGLPALCAHLRGACSLEAAIETGIADTRRYARRQDTWFRNQMADWPRVALGPGDDPAQAALDALHNAL